MLLTCLLASGSLMILSQLFCLNNSFHITLTLFLPHEGAKVKRGTVLTELQMDDYMWNVQLKGLNYIKCWHKSFPSVWHQSWQDPENMA